MKALICTAMALALLAVGIHPASAHGGAKGKAVKLKGEIVDLQCFMTHKESGQGAGHIKCARLCINKGLPIGFKAENGKVYLLLGEEHDNIQEYAAKNVGVPTTIEGTLIEHDGIRAIQVETGEAHDEGTKEEKPKAAGAGESKP